MISDKAQVLYESQASELRRGVLVLAVLSHLRQQEYGYSLKQALAAQGLDINEGTLYPLLRRLEGQGLLSSDWQVVDDARPRRYYALSPLGKEVLRALTADWFGLVTVMDDILQKKVEDFS